MKTETQCLHAGYTPKNGEPRVLPVVQSTTFTYDSTAEVARLFDLEETGFFYSRIGNPTVDAVEKKIAALEGGVGALCTSSGQAAVLLAALNLARCGDHIVSAASIYGGTHNLFDVTLRRFGIETTFVDQDASDEELARAFRPTTRLVYGETLANPALSVLDIERFARLAHARGLPLLVDNTFATPVLCRPMAFGADIVIHSTTKYMDSSAAPSWTAAISTGVRARFRNLPSRTPPITALSMPMPSGARPISPRRASSSCAIWAAARPPSRPLARGARQGGMGPLSASFR